MMHRYIHCIFIHLF